MKNDWHVLVLRPDLLEELEPVRVGKTISERDQIETRRSKSVPGMSAVFRDDYLNGQLLKHRLEQADKVRVIFDHKDSRFPGHDESP